MNEIMHWYNLMGLLGFFAQTNRDLKTLEPSHNACTLQSYAFLSVQALLTFPNSKFRISGKDLDDLNPWEKSLTRVYGS